MPTETERFQRSITACIENAKRLLEDAEWSLNQGSTGLALALLAQEEAAKAFVLTLVRDGVLRRCCTNRDWPARCHPTGSSPADAIRRRSAEGGHPIEDLTAEDDLTPLASWTPGAKASADDGLVAEERVLHPALTMVP